MDQLLVRNQKPVPVILVGGWAGGLYFDYFY